MGNFLERIFSDFNSMKELGNSEFIRVDLKNPILRIYTDEEIKLIIGYIVKRGSNDELESTIIYNDGTLSSIEDDESDVLFSIGLDSDLSFNLQNYIKYRRFSDKLFDIEFLNELLFLSRNNDLFSVECITGSFIRDFLKFELGVNVTLNMPNINNNIIMKLGDIDLVRVPVNIYFGNHEGTDFLLVSDIHDSYNHSNYYNFPIFISCNNIHKEIKLISEILIYESTRLGELFNKRFTPEIESCLVFPGYESPNNLDVSDLLNIKDELNDYLEKHFPIC